ncbi:retrovirus-related pol polyprotein from transposon TNT 1-94 [Tanacetum coccineum]
MYTLAEIMILSGADNRSPMLEKHLYDSWKSRMELYMQNREHEIMILESVEHGPLIWPTIEENGVTRTKKYEELSATKKIQVDCDLKATNIILQGLPSDVYSLVINDMNIYKMKLEQFQVNTKFLNSLPPEWSKFVTDVKLGRQSTFAAGTSGTRANISGICGNNSGQQRVMKCFNYQGEGHMARQCPKPKRKRDAIWFRDKVLLVEAEGSDPRVVEGLVTQTVITHNEAYQADNLDAYDPDCDDFSTAKAVLMANLSTYESDVLSEVPRSEITHNDMLNQSVQEMQYSEQTHLVNYPENEVNAYVWLMLLAKGKLMVNFQVLNSDKMKILMLEESRVESRKGFCHNSINNDLRKFKGNDIVDNAAQVSNAPGMYKLDPEILGAILREVVEQVKSRNPLDSAAYSACMYVNLIQELLGYVRDTCPDIHKFRVKPTTSASGSKHSGNTKNDRISRPPNSNEKNKVQVQSRKVKFSLNKKYSDSKNVCNEHVKDSVKGAKALCSICNECMFDANHAMCRIDHVNSVNVRAKSVSKKNKKRKEWKPTGKVFNSVGYKWKPTGRTFTLVENACPLTRITATNKVPLREPIPLKVVAQEPVVTKVYTRRPKVPKTIGSNSKPKIVKSLNANKTKPGTSQGSNTSVAPSSSSLIECRLSKLFCGNVTISRVCYVEGLGHNLFSVGQFCDSDLEVAFRKHTCFVRNLEGVHLLSRSRGTNLYSFSIGDMMASSPISLLSKDTKTKSWLWHRRLSHLNFAVINHLARHGLVRGLPRIKFEKDHMCSACAMGKSKKQSHKPKSEDTNQEKLYLLHMNLGGPMRIASVTGKKYILVIVKDYSRFTWVKFLASKDEAPDFIIKFLKMIQVRLNATVRNIRTDNGTEFVNQTLRDYYEQDSFQTLLLQHHLPPSRHEWDLVFQPVFDEFFSTPASVASPVPIVEAPAPVESTDSPSSTSVDQDAPSPSTYQSTQQSQSHIIPLSAEEETHDLEVAHMSNDPYFGIPIPDIVSEQSSSSDVIPTTVHSDAPIS